MEIYAIMSLTQDNLLLSMNGGGILELYKFQKKTLDNVLLALKTRPVVVLSSDAGTGKSTMLKGLQKITINSNNYSVIKCVGSFDKKYTDYSCLPEDFIDEIKWKNDKKALRNSVLKDIAGTISNVMFLQTENTLDNLLSRNDEEYLEQIITFLIKKSEKNPFLFIFDALSYLDYKSHMLMYSLITEIENARLNNIRLIIAVDTEEQEELTLLKNLKRASIALMQTDLPTDSDLCQIIDPSLMDIARCIPLKALLEIGNQIDNIHYYMKGQLEKDATSNTLGEIILLVMAVFEYPMTFADIIVFANRYDDYEIYQTVSKLVELKLVVKQSDIYDDYYEISGVYRNAILDHVPEYLITNKLQIYIKHLENSLEFRYYQKFQVYKKICAIKNACVNAVLAYCSYARDLLIISGQEVIIIKSFLESSHYAPLFAMIEKGYSLYRKEQYEACHALLNTYLSDNHFVSDNAIRCYSYSAEFLLEMIYLIALCSLRMETITSDQMEQDKQHLKLAIETAEHLNNDEFILRLKELHLLIEIAQTREQAHHYFDAYFAICSVYHDKIRTANVWSRVYWETRYGMHLLRINSISGVPNKLTIINEGFEIAKRHKCLFPKLYLRASCNYACDIIWRGEYEESYRVLYEAVSFIKENNVVSHWGIIVQMYTFAALFAEKDTGASLLQEYNRMVWDNGNVRKRMHEPFLCISNYAILLASNHEYDIAYSLIKEAQSQCPKDKLYELFLMTTNLGALAYMLGKVEKAIRLEAECSKMLKEKEIPNFSKPFLYKRNTIIMDIYQNGIPIRQVEKPHESGQILSTGYCSDNYTRLMLFSDINYWAN